MRNDMARSLSCPSTRGRSAPWLPRASPAPSARKLWQACVGSDTGRTGWYYRVLEAGDVAPGEPLTLVERPWPNWPLSRLWQVLNQSALDREALAELATLEVLAPGWRETARKRLENGKAEGLGQRLGRLFGK